MQTEHEGDNLHSLLHREYAAPPLDDRFSADLIARLRAEAAASPAVVRTRGTRPAICLLAATAAAVVVTAIWSANPAAPGTDHKTAQDARREGVRSGEALSAKRENGETEFATHVEQEHESLVRENLAEDDNSLSTELSVLPDHREPWRNVSAAAALADVLYVVSGNRLYEVGPGDGSRRPVGNDDWRSTAAICAAGERLYIVCGGRLYKVNPATGSRRILGEPDWADATAITATGRELYIACGGRLHHVNPLDGRHEELGNSDTNDPDKPKQ